MTFNATKEGFKEEKFDPIVHGFKEEKSFSSKEEFMKALRNTPHAAAAYATGFTSPLVQGLQNIGKGSDYLRQFLQGVPASKINTEGVEFLPHDKTLSDIELKDNPNRDVADLGEMANTFLIPQAKISSGANYLTRASSRILPMVSYGATTNKNPEEGAIHGLEGAVGGELLGGAAKLAPKGMQKTAELLNPQGFTNELIKTINQRYNSAKEAASALYESVKKKYGSENLYNKKPTQEGDFHKALSEIEPEHKFSSATNRLMRKFDKDSNLTNAHELQTQMGQEIGELQRSKIKTQDDRNQISNLHHVRSGLNKDINNNLDIIDVNAAHNWKQANKIYREDVAPYRANSNLHLIAEGNKKTISSYQLKNSIQKVAEFSGKHEKIPQAHYLRGALKELKSKYYRGKLIEGIGSLGAGFAVGGPLGAIVAKSVSPYMAKLAQNPYLLDKLTKIEKFGKHPLVPMAKNAIIANIMNQE